MKKNILITGLPKSGKSTLMKNIISKIPNKKGFLTTEIKKDGNRVGFEIVTSEGNKKILAHIDFTSSFKVSKYFVDIKGLDECIEQLFSIESNDFLYIDEIGEMELYSEKFRKLVKMYLDSPNLFFATMSQVYSDNFIESIKRRKDVIVFEITPENRDKIFEKMKTLISSYIK